MNCQPAVHWNWKHLFPVYVFGVLLRYLVIFPIRLAILLVGLLITLLLFALVTVRRRAE